jgi:hypothetical protein
MLNILRTENFPRLIQDYQYLMLITTVIRKGLLPYSTLHMLQLKRSKNSKPVTVAERSKACTVFARSEDGIVGSNPTQDMDVWCVCVCVFLCLGRGLATSWSPVQGDLPSVNDQETEKSALCSEVGASSQMGAKRKKKKRIQILAQHH